jgi:antitoxin HicB
LLQFHFSRRSQARSEVKDLRSEVRFAKAIKKKKISKARMAALLKTSRSQVDRILDPKRDITLSSLQRAAALVGQRVVIELV